MLCSFSKLDGGGINVIKLVEQRIGKTILAFNCLDLAPAGLTEEELALITEAERRLGLILVAVKS